MITLFLFYITILNAMVNSMFFAFITNKYEHFLLIRYMPGFSKQGVLYTNSSVVDTCDGIVECAHYICKYNYSYRPMYETECNMIEDELIKRSDTEYIYTGVRDIMMLIGIQLLVMLLANTSLPFIKRYSIRLIPHIMFTSTSLFIISEIMVKIYMLYVIEDLRKLAPDIPMFMLVWNDDILILAYLILTSHLILNCIIVIYLTIKIIRSRNIIEFSPLENNNEDSFISFRRDNYVHTKETDIDTDTDTYSSGIYEVFEHTDKRHSM